MGNCRFNTDPGRIECANSIGATYGAYVNTYVFMPYLEQIWTPCGTKHSLFTDYFPNVVESNRSKLAFFQSVPFRLWKCNHRLRYRYVEKKKWRGKRASLSCARLFTITIEYSTCDYVETYLTVSWKSFIVAESDLGLIVSLRICPPSPLHGYRIINHNANW